jgi:hypothetical protein
VHSAKMAMNPCLTWSGMFVSFPCVLRLSAAGHQDNGWVNTAGTEKIVWRKLCARTAFGGVTLPPSDGSDRPVAPVQEQSFFDPGAPSCRTAHFLGFLDTAQIARSDGFRRGYLPLISWLRPARRELDSSKDRSAPLFDVPMTVKEA